MLAEIRWTSRRDLCFTAANARPIDKEEIIASGPRSMTECGYLTWEAMEQWGGIGWTVWLDGNPEFSFGFTPQNPFMPHLCRRGRGVRRRRRCACRRSTAGASRIWCATSSTRWAAPASRRGLYTRIPTRNAGSRGSVSRRSAICQSGAKTTSDSCSIDGCAPSMSSASMATCFTRGVTVMCMGGSPPPATILHPATGPDGSGNRGGTGRGSDDRGTGTHAKC